jgi:polyphenol oxidase
MIATNIYVLDGKKARSEFFTLKQCHSSSVVCITNDSLWNDIEADASITSEKNLTMAILTADCIPVTVYDELAGLVSIAHCGWKGTLHGILDSLIQKLVTKGALQTNIQCFIGPGICGNCYQVSAERAKMFLDKFDRKETDDSIYEKNQRWNIDLKRLIRNILVTNGIQSMNIKEDIRCSSHDGALPSYRRNGFRPPTETIVSTISIA